MAKKRKAGGQPKTPTKAEENPSKRVRMNFNSYEDVAGSDDEFHINRDKILLDEGADAKRQRQWDEKDEFLERSDEEVMGHSDEEEEINDDSDSENDVFMTPAPRRTTKNIDESEDEDGAGAEEDEDDERWGTTKKDYYGADEMETEQDALDEEKEAKRLQQKQLQSMTAADYGFDEDEWQEAKKDAKENGAGAVVTEVLPQLQISKDMTSAERVKLLKSRYPEFTPLSKDFLDVQEQMASLLEESTQAQEAVQKHAAVVDEQYVPIAVTKFRAASAYQAVLSMYFALLTSTAKDSHSEAIALSANVLRDHAVMDSLLKAREMWMAAKDIPSEDIDELVEDIMDGEADSAEDVESEDEVVEIKQRKKKRGRKTKAQKEAAAAKVEEEAKRAERMRQTEADLADLDSLLVKKPKKAKAAKPVQFVHDDEDSDFGEETEVNAEEAAEKARKKKSLRFYTSQIAQKANKRNAAGNAVGGDDDVPHRERLRDRQARLMTEAAKRGRKPAAAGEELGGDSDEEDRRQAKEVRGEVNNEDDYYDMVAAKASKKKWDKKALADAQNEAEKLGGRVVEQESVGADGKRKISYLIEKNKGLTPHRKKDVRNPRVKKRKKYEEKKKKLSSMKPVYKGGEGKGGYKGEMTGIKTGLVKSRRL